MERFITLDQIASVFNGKTPSQEDQRQIGFPVLKIKDVDEFGAFVGSFDSFVDRAFAERWRDKKTEVGDTLILNAAHSAEYIGSKTFFVAGTASGALAAGEWLIIRPDRREVNESFLYYWTSWANKQLRALVRGIHLYPKDVAQMRLTLPDLAHQKRIAAILERADRLRRLRRYALEISSELLSACFMRKFGDPISNPLNWEIVELDELCDLVRGSSPRPQGDPRFFKGPVPRLMIADITRDGVYVTPTIDSLTAEGAKRSRPMEAGSVVMAGQWRCRLTCSPSLQCVHP